MHDKRKIPARGTALRTNLEVAIELFWNDNPSYHGHVNARIDTAQDGRPCLLLSTDQREYWSKLLEIVPDGKYYGMPTGIELRHKL